MEVIYGLIPGMIVMGLVAVVVFFWAAKSGQFDDLQGEAHRILMDDDLDDLDDLEEVAPKVETPEAQQPNDNTEADSPAGESDNSETRHS